MKFVGGYSYNGSVFFVHFFDFEDVSAMVEKIMVEFVPEGYGCEFGTGKRCEWVESDSIEVEKEDIEESGNAKTCPNRTHGDLDDVHFYRIE